MSNLMKLRTVGAGLFHADVKTHRQTDVQTGTAKLIAASSTFAKEPEERA